MSTDPSRASNYETGSVPSRTVKTVPAWGWVRGMQDRKWTQPGPCNVIVFDDGGKIGFSGQIEILEDGVFYSAAGDGYRLEPAGANRKYTEAMGLHGFNGSRKWVYHAFEEAVRARTGGGGARPAVTRSGPNVRIFDQRADPRSSTDVGPSPVGSDGGDFALDGDLEAASAAAGLASPADLARFQGIDQQVDTDGAGGQSPRKKKRLTGVAAVLAVEIAAERSGNTNGQSGAAPLPATKGKKANKKGGGSGIGATLAAIFLFWKWSIFHREKKTAGETKADVRVTAPAPRGDTADQGGKKKKKAVKT